MGKDADKITTMLSMMTESEKAIYEPILAHLSELGYRPQKQSVQGYVLSFRHKSSDTQIAKMGVRGKEPKAFFALRFSACGNYSQKLEDVVKHRVLSKGEHYQAASCATCNNCKGGRHTYTYVSPDGEVKTRCGAYVLEIPDVSPDDIKEIKRLLDEQHLYFVKYAV